MGYLTNQKSSECYGCEACIQICPKEAINLVEDQEGFRYPKINKDLCVKCNKCLKVCPQEFLPEKYSTEQTVFGGFIKDKNIREQSTSGGAFSAIAISWAKLHPNNFVIFGATSDKLEVYHTYITDISNLHILQKSKYAQSSIGESFKNVKSFLENGKWVLFSGTPCQIAGLRRYLNDKENCRLLTVEVICEGIPSPLYVRKYNEWCVEKYNSPISKLDYRYKDKNKWDFQVMYTLLENLHHFKIDRWFNPFWTIWLSHLMSRPSCYECKFTTLQRVADITLGDLWGVHLYCPELYGHNTGSSLIICNSNNGKELFNIAKQYMYGHELDLDTAKKYQSPLRKPIEKNPLRKVFLKDCRTLAYENLNKKWAKKNSPILLLQKYLWGNRVKVMLRNLSNRLN